MVSRILKQEFIIIMRNLILILCCVMVACSSQPEPQPEPKPEFEWTWHLQDKSLLSKTEQYDELMRTLKYVDEQIVRLDQKGKLWTSKTGVNHFERSQYLEIRLQLLYHIYNVSDFLQEE